MNFQGSSPRGVMWTVLNFATSGMQQQEWGTANQGGSPEPWSWLLLGSVTWHPFQMSEVPHEPGSPMPHIVSINYLVWMKALCRQTLYIKQNIPRARFFGGFPCFEMCEIKTSQDY